MAAPSAVDELELVRRLRAEAGIVPTAVPDAPLQQVAQPAPMLPAAAKPDAELAMVAMLRRQAGIVPPEAMQPAAPLLAPATVPGMVQAQLPPITDKWFKKVFDRSGKFIGTPYVWGGNNEKGVDCSGFTCAAYKEVGVNLPRTAREQAKKGREVAWEDMQPGDALYFDMKGKGDVTHTGIFIGNGKMRHASSGQGRVTDVNLSGYWKKRTVTVRRFSGGDEPNVKRETKQQEPPNIDSMIAEMRRRKAEVDALPVQTNASIKERIKVVKEINRLERRKREIASEPAAKALAEGFLSGGTLGAHQAFHKFATGVEKEESKQRFDTLTEGAPTLRKGAEVSQNIAGAIKRKEKIQRMMKSSSDPTLAKKVKKIDAYIAELTPKRVQFGYLASNLPPLTEETLPQWDKRLKDLDTAHEVTLNARSKIKDKSSPRFKELDTRLGELKRLRANLWKQLPQSLRGKETGWALAAKREQELQGIDVKANKGGKRIPYVSSFVGGAESVVEGVAPIMAGFWNLGLGKVFGEVDTREVGRAVASKQEARALKDPNIGEVLAGGLGSTLPLFLPGAAVGRTAKLGQWAKGSILGVSEASTNAGLHYSRLVGEGKSHNEALNVAVKQFVAEAPIDTIMARFGFFGKSPSGNFGQRLKGLAKNARPEAFQEGIQGFIADAAAGREFDPSNYTFDGLIGYAVSFILGAPVLIAKNPGMEKRVGELMRSMEKQITAQAPAQPTKFVKTAPAGQALPTQIKPGKPPVAIPARGKPLTLPEQPKALPGAAPAKPAAPVTPMTEIAGTPAEATATEEYPYGPEGMSATEIAEMEAAEDARKRTPAWQVLTNLSDESGARVAPNSMTLAAAKGDAIPNGTYVLYKGKNGEDKYTAYWGGKAVGRGTLAEAMSLLERKATEAGVQFDNDLESDPRRLYRSNLAFPLPVRNLPSPAPESVVEPVSPVRKQMGVPEPVEIKGGKPVAPERLGAKTKVKVPQMDDIDVRYAVVDLKDLVISHDKNFNPNPKYAESLQPRDRTAANLKKQVEGIAKKFDPREVADSIHAATGAPIIDPETHIVEVGNGRLMAFKKAPVSKVKAYRDFLTKNAEKFGLTSEQIAAVKSPVLVRVRETAMTPEQRQEFTRRANEDIVAGESTADQAKTDTAALTDDVVNFLVENDLGDISNPQNSRFVSTFLDKLSVNTRADMLDPQGALSQQGIRRIEAAVLNKAYGSPKLTAKAFEDIDPNVKRILTGLKSAAPAYLKYRAEVDKGDAHNLDISTEIVDTVLLLDRLREQGMTPQDYIDQDAMFDTEADARAKEILGVLAVKTPERGAIFDSAKRVREFIHNYVELARKQGKPSQGALVKGEAVKSKDALIKQAADQVAGETASLFGMAEAVVEGTKPAEKTEHQKELEARRKADKKANWKEGDTIIHPEFGEGEVIKQGYARGNYRLFTIQFESGIKQFTGYQLIEAGVVPAKLDVAAEKKRIETEDAQPDPIFSPENADGSKEMASGLPFIGKIAEGMGHYFIRGTGFLGKTNPIRTLKGFGHTLFSDAQTLVEQEGAKEISRDLHTIAIDHDKMTHEFLTLISAEVKAQFGLLANLTPSAAASLRGNTESIAYKKQHNVPMNSKEEGLWSVWRKITREINRQAKELGIQVERVVGEHPSADLLVGKDVTFFEFENAPASSIKPDGTVIVSGGGSKVVQKGKIKAVKSSKILIEGDNGTKYELRSGVRFYTETLVENEVFFPIYLKEDIIAKLEANDPETVEKQVQWLIDKKLADSRDVAHRIIQDAIRDDNSIFVNGIAKSRLQVARKSHIFHPDFFDYNFERGAERYIRSATMDIATAKVWGADREGYGEKVSKLVNSSRVNEIVTAVTTPPASSATTRAAEVWSRRVSGGVALAYLGLSVNTMITQLGATSQLVGTVGAIDSMKGLGTILYDRGIKGGDLIDEIKMSGVTDQDLTQLFTGDEISDKFTDLVKLSLAGMRAVDQRLRIVSAAASIAGVRRAARKVLIGKDGKIKDSAAYRFLSDWARYQDAEIIELAKDQKALYERGNLLRVKAMFAGVKTQVTSRAIDRPFSMHNSPLMQVVMRLRSYGFKQAQLMGWTLKEATKGNPVPFLRLMIAGALVGEGVGWLKDLFKEHILGTTPKERATNGKRILGLIAEGKVDEALGELPAYVLEGNIIAGTFGLYNDYFGEYKGLEKIVVFNMVKNVIDAIEYAQKNEDGNAFIEWMNKQFVFVKNLHQFKNKGKSYREKYPLPRKDANPLSGMNTLTGSK